MVRNRFRVRVSIMNWVRFTVWIKVKAKLELWLRLVIELY